MADDELMEAEDNIVFPDTPMFRAPQEVVSSVGSILLGDEEIETGTSEDTRLVKDFGFTWKFDYEAGEFLKQGSGNQLIKIDGREAFAEWCNNVLHIERFSSYIYSDQIGVEFAQLVREAEGAEVAASMLLSIVTEALSVHDRFDSIEDFAAGVDDNGVVQINMTIKTTDGSSVDLETSVAA